MRDHPMRSAMMNIVAIGLVLSTLAAAGVWMPAPAPPESRHGEHVVREGRRVVIVEYERELPLSDDRDGVKEARVLSPHAIDGGEARGEVSDEARGAVAGVADKVAGVAEDGKEKPTDAKESGKGKVLDAVWRCKDRLCGAARRAEDDAEEAASRVKHDAEEAASRVKHGAEDAARGAEEALSGAKDRVEHKVFDAASEAKEKASKAAGEAKEKASHVKDGAAGTLKSAKGKVFGAAKNAKDNVKEAAMNARDRVSDFAERAEEYAQDAAERAAENAAEAEEAVKEKAEEVTKNLTDIGRRARGVASDAAAYLVGAPREATRTATAVMHLLGFAAAYGASVWVTFVSSYVLAAALPRQQLGVVQSKLYPVYFRAVAYGVGLALAAHLLDGGRERSTAAAAGAQSLNLLGALALVLANMLLFEPKATKVMFERMKLEKEEGRGRDMADIVDPHPAVAAAATRVPTPAEGVAAGKAAKGAVADAATAAASKSSAVRLHRRLKQLNGYSSLCNVLALMALTWHLVHLARRLQMSTAC